MVQQLAPATTRVPEAGQPARGVHAEVGSGDGAGRCLNSSRAGGRARSPTPAAGTTTLSQPSAVGQFDGRPLVVLREAGHRAAAPDLRPRSGRVFPDEADDDRLRNASR